VAFLRLDDAGDVGRLMLSLSRDLTGLELTRVLRPMRGAYASTIFHPKRNTRRAYAQAVREFLAWCEHHRVRSIAAVQPMHVAGYIEELTRERSAPTAKQRLAAIFPLGGTNIVCRTKTLAQLIAVDRRALNRSENDGSISE
jgi:hypothetical protein